MKKYDSGTNWAGVFAKSLNRKDPDYRGECPRCDSPIIGEPTLSRRDNKTNICSKCGIEETLQDNKKLYER